MYVTLNGDVLVDWRRWRLPRRGSTARNSAVMATAMATWCQTPVGRSVSRTARAGSAGGKRSSERHGRTVER